MAHRIIQTPDDLDALGTLFAGLKRPFTVEWVPGRDRTNDQNRLMWLWASEAADQRGDVTADEVQREWKLRYGVPILRDDSAEFREVYDGLMKDRLSYEEKLDAMRLIDVTSALKVRQMVRFLDTISRECAEQGIKLTDPDPDLAAYQARNRDRKAA